MADSHALGIDCGGTKVMAQSVKYNSITGLVSPGDFQLEVNYSDSPKWNSKFIPVHLDLQRQEFSEGNIYLTQLEMDQGDVIVETIQDIISKSESDSIGLCFPGIKDDRGVVVMANGPRIPDFLDRIQGIGSLPHDSDCCVLGEWKSTVGKLQNCDNAVYIGGGTGIADGIILEGKMIDFNEPGSNWWSSINILSGQDPNTELPDSGTGSLCLNRNGKLYVKTTTGWKEVQLK